MWTWISIAVVVVFCLYALNKTAFRRVKDGFSAQVGKGAKVLWSADPLAVKNAEIDHKAEELSEATRGLESCRALIAGVERQVKVGTTESNRLQALAEQYVKEHNDNKAKEKLVEKTRVDNDLTTNREQLKIHQETYDAWRIKIQNATNRIAELRQEARGQGVRLQMSKAEANLAKLGSTMGKTNLSFDSLGEVNDEIEAQIDQNRAKGQVVHDLAREGLEEIDAENRAFNSQAEDALTALKAKMK
jgi:phage shock protein A